MRTKVVAAVGVVLIAALTWLWQKSQSLSPEDHARVDSALRELRSLDRMINLDVLRVRYQLVDSYAPVLHSYRRVELLEAVIATSPRYVDDGARPQLAAAVTAYRAAITAKQGLIEAFKYRTSDLMELLAYLPAAGSGISAAARASGEVELATSANQVLQLALLYNLTSDERYAILLRERSAELAAAGDSVRSYRLRRRIGTLTLNIRRLLEVKPAADRLLRRVLEQPVAAHEDEVARLYYVGYAATEHVARRWRGVLYGACVALLGLVGYAVRRLRHSARALAASNERLEEHVADRTRELDARNRELDASLVELRDAQGRLVQSAQVLADVSRRAGMAEIATGVLHNVGNALNGVNVSAELAGARLRALKVPSIGRIAEVIEANGAHLATYLIEDPAGRNLPAYLKRLGENLCAERDAIVGELRTLQRHVDHINRIVSKQQDYAKTMGVNEPCRASQLVEDALALAGAQLAKLGIEVVRQHGTVPEAMLDRHRVLQILVNLVGNAKHALAGAARPDRRLTVRTHVIEAGDSGIIEIGVEDNGVGIAPEDMARLFTHGFTTKKGGHGFGLHASALAAKEMGGALTCRSDGRGQGAAFVLRLPLLRQPRAD